jgi:alpha-2-macroglobulin
VTLIAPAERHHVALVDPLPAGFEPLNPLLALNDVDTHGSEPSDEQDSDEDAASEGRWRWRSLNWFVHHNLRDDRAEAFATSLGAGVYRFEYLARATTKGRFVAPAPKAEEMYAPETYGRGVVDRVVVE